MDSDHLAIVWITSVPPNVCEVRYSYSFCRTLSLKHAASFKGKMEWLDCPADSSLNTLLEKTSAKRFLIVSDPELILSPEAVDRLYKSACAEHERCGPVYNESSHPQQVAELPYPYYNEATFLEVARLLADAHPLTLSASESLDPACVLYQRNTLECLDDTIALKDLSEAVTGTSGVDFGAFAHRFANYYHAPRADLVQLVPETVRTVLDVGCANGGYGKHLKQARPEIRLTGVEQNPLMAEAAKPYYDDIITSAIENVPPASEYDLINCGDVLEHLVNPWEMLQIFNQLLKVGGYLITSLPNAGHWSIVKDLLKGTFDYLPVGLLCVTHIRWFTEASITKALQDAGFKIDIFLREQHPPTPEGSRFVRRMCEQGDGDEISLLTHGFIIRAVKDA